MTALIFIIRALFGLLVTAFLLRVLLPLCRADARNPLSQAVIRITNPLVLPLRRLLPPVRRLDTGSVVALVLVQFAATSLVWLLVGNALNVPMLLISVARDLTSILLQFYFVAILVYALLSWIAPGTYSPAANLLESLCRPVLRPFQRFIPPIGGLDISALIALIVIQALQIALNS